MNGYERITAMLDGQPVDHVPYMPITMMFAGDYAGIPYGQYATNFEKLVEAQIRTAEDFQFDYVSVISDPSREAADCGATIQYYDNQPPAIDEMHALLLDKKTLASLSKPDPLGGGRMHDRVKAAERFRQQVGGEYLIEGWVEGPCAEAADLRGINNLMLDFMDDPGFVRDLFEFIVGMEIDFAKAQVEAGVDLIGVGDAAASLVGPAIYNEFVLPYEKRIVDAIHEMGCRVRLHICGNTSRILDGMGTVGADFVDLDSKAPMDKAREEMGPDQVLAGNIDPVSVLRNGTPQGIAEALAECHRASGAKYIVTAGCEVPRDTPAENLNAMRDYAQSHPA